MKTWWKYTWMLSVVAFAAASLIACAKKNDGGGGVQNCGVNEVRDANGNCVHGLVQIPGSNARVGFYAQTASFPYYGNGGSIMNVNNTGFHSVLKDAMGVCDRDHANGGLSACSAWMAGYHDIVLMFPNGSSSNSAYLVVRSYPKVDPYYNYSYSMPSADQFFGAFFGFYIGNYSGMFNPLVLQSTVWPINSNKGFEIRADGPTGSYASNKLFQLQVTNGKLEDGTINYTLYFNGQVAVTGTMVRCTTTNCGIQGL